MRDVFVSYLLAASLLFVAPTAVRAQDQSQSEACQPLSSSVSAYGEAAVAAGAPGLVVAVAQPGEPPLIQAFGMADIEHTAAMRPDSVFRIASLTKQFTAALVLDLVEEGRLGLHDKAAIHLPELTWLGDITVYQLLVQTSGLPDYAQDPAGEATKATVRSPAEMLTWIGRLAASPDFAPGERWAYSNSNYAVLGALVERLTGQSFEEAMTSRILAPAGLQATTVDDPRHLVPHRVRGYSALARRPLRLANAAWIHPSMPGPAGSLRSTAQDLLMWNQALFSGVVLGEASIADMTAAGRLGDGRTTKLGMPEAWQAGLNADYAMGLFRSSSPLGVRLWHSGDIDGFVTWMAHYPETGVTIVLLQNGDFLDVDHAAIEQMISLSRGCYPRR